MLRLLLFFAFLYCLMRLFRALMPYILGRILQRTLNQAMQKNMASQAHPQTLGGKMVPCATCQLFIPENTAVSGQGLYFCDNAHRTQYSKQ